MIMKKYKIYLGALLMVLFATVSSCDEVGDIDVGGVTVQDMTGEWYVETSVDGTVVVGYAAISTYNSAANIEEMWIDDQQHIWWFKAKAPVTLSSLSFSGTDLASSYDGYDITVTITNGVVNQDVVGATSAGNTSDTISFDIEFSDDPGTIYHIEGYRRTGFAEDEH